MKTTVLLLAGMLITAATLRAQDIVALWDFNGAGTTPAIGTGGATAVGGVSESFAAGSAEDPGAPNDAWSLSRFPAQGTAPLTAGVRFAASTAGFERIGFRFDFRASNTASRRLMVRASTDGIAFVE